MLQTTMQVKIHNNIYNIHLINKNSKYLVMDDGEVHSGVTDFITKDIYIRNDLNDSSLKYTLYHEITHAYIESYGLLQIDWNDEIVADFVANYMIDILGTIDEITSKLRRVVINYETNKKKNNKHSF
jgi:hypothetical protein